MPPSHLSCSTVGSIFWPMSHGPPTESIRSHRNNFDALRLALASLVLFSHSYVLAGSTDPIAILSARQLDGGALAVDGFFVISGYLITQSWLSSASTDGFLRKRIRRIYPGYIAAVAVSFLIAALLSPTLRYIKLVAFNSDGFVRGILLLKYGFLDNSAAFASNPFPGAVNGSLWTLQPELCCYLLVAGLGVTGVLHHRRWVLALAAIVYAIYAVQVGTRLGAGPTDFTRLLLYFMMGAVWFLYRPSFGRRWALVVCAVLLIVGRFVSPLLVLGTPLMGSYLLLSLAFSSRIRLYDAAKRGDFSYGVYLYAFVVQQSVIATLRLANRPLAVLFVAFPVTLCCAWLSWHLVEKRFIQKGNRSIAGSPIARSTSTPAIVAG